MLEDEIARLEVYMGEKLDAQDLKVEETIAQARDHLGGAEHGGAQARGGGMQKTQYGRVQAFILLLWQLQFRVWEGP